MTMIFTVSNPLSKTKTQVLSGPFRPTHSKWMWNSRFYLGIILFCTGMFINLQADHILRNLRKPGETGYKIPRGGLFEYVSGANFFGEIVEWLGFAVANGTLPTFAFFFFTLCNIGPRACHHHQ
ncbi:3-oxo-5-alpha-steroid 4-dehydrogenase 2-like isoform X2 [Crassostrea angulata]|nr:3-oxo-5-alpha-steroid 4-dehydrogenase 2-like isoform X2 [Crassostrea angulata]